MPAEVRYVIFHLSEAVVAITEYWTRRKMPLPIGTVVPSLNPNGLASILLKVSGDDDREAPTEIKIETIELAAALILYCRARKIPLPATAEKSLTVVGRHLGLILTLNADETLFADLRPSEILMQSPPPLNAR